MANANPSGPNQPLNQHPLSSAQGPVLGSDVATLTGLVQGAHLLLAPPPAGVCRVFGGRLAVAVSGGSVGITLVELFIKDADGRERMLATAAAVGIGAVEEFASNGLQKLLASDQGVFLRFVGGAVPGDVTAYLAFDDVRGLTRTDTEISVAAGTSVVVLTPAVPEGNVLKSANAEGPTGLRQAYIEAFNFGSGTPSVTLELFDGTNIFPLKVTALIAALTANVTSSVVTGLAPAADVVIPPGSSLRARLSAASVAGPVSISVATRWSNQSPVREDQGGAY